MTTSNPASLFFRTGDGSLAAAVEDYCYLAVPDGQRWRIAGAWRLSKPRETWETADFYSYEGFVDSEDAFRAYVEDYAEHRRQLRDLPRPERRFSIGTPWGMPQTSYVYAEGVVFHSTASHGGFKLDETCNAEVPEPLRNADGWYEEDAEWAKVTVAFPALFTDRERRQSDDTVRNEWPDYWEAAHGRDLAPGESSTKDRRLFDETHAQHWIVMSAHNSSDYPGRVVCFAALGGNRGASTRRTFLVPSDEYDPGRFGFVIDESRHRQI